MSGSTIVRSLATGLVVGSLVAVLTSIGALSLPKASAATSSAVTVTTADTDPDAANAPFPDLSVTVSQTTDLLSQGIVISWTGGKKSARPTGSVGGENFLQIAQCWGEDPDNPGHPDRTTCQYGAFLSGGSTRDSFVQASNVDPHDVQYTAMGNGSFFNPPYTAVPFVAVDGTTVASVLPDTHGVNQKVPDVDVNTNRFFTQYTSNEVTWAGSDESGTGSVKFELQTSTQSPGLGCGQPIVAADQSVLGQSCWLVVIPRGEGDSGDPFISKSGLLWDAWKHNIAVKLDFKPVGVRCAIGVAERQLSGSELIAGAVAAWQPNLCLGANGSAFAMSTGSEADVLEAASQTTPGPLAFTSRPLETEGPDPLSYAPVGLSGVALTFSVDRRVQPGGSVPGEYKDAETTPFSELELTPRLVAKLLTSSYWESLPAGADRSDIGFISVDDPGPNAANLTKDQDFLAINDEEWKYQDLSSPALADLLAPSGRSDLATQLWRYVLADADAVAFLDGTADPWGMKVNPWYSTNASINPSGTGLTLPRDNFPKADPVEKPATTGSSGSGPVNLLTWRPYTSDFEQGAYLTLRGDGQLLGGWDTTTAPPKYQKTPRNLLGEQKVLGLSTTASAARYQNVTASLRNPAGQFVAPTSTSMLAAAAAMTRTAASTQVYEYDPASASAKGATTAYPLTMPVYAALNPLQTDSSLRAIYANFIRYAVTDGQVPGADIGHLPDGYAPIPQGWIDQALASATAIENGVSPIVAPPTDGGGLSGGYYPPSDAAGGSTDPTATGDAAGDLAGPETPADPELAPTAMAIPLGLLSGLAAAAAVPLLPRIRRKF